ncbi:MAG: ABC transporter permease [Caldilineaceae bacterium]
MGKLSSRSASAGTARARPWSLQIGLLLVTLVLLLAWLGPLLASHDPAAPSYIIWNPRTAAFVKPPFGALTVPGFPLGTDAMGRDILSRLLWAIRPTLILTVLVAAIRLLLALFFGVAAGWSGPRGARLFDSLIAVALAVPVFLVALFTVAALGIQLGIGAFIIGLTLTAWADGARIIGEQTRIVKGQPYMEAARALGASPVELIVRHVMPQIMGLIWMLLAFEISGALLVTAGLGFLGYYVNAVWVPLGDWSAMRTSGQPELGQMLASGGEVVLQQPLELLVTATVITVIVLGFNLLGEGLRLWTVGEGRRQRRQVMDRVRQRVGSRLPQREHGFASLLRNRLTAVASIGVLLLLTVGGALVLWQAQAQSQPQIAVTVPGGHQWAAARHDAQGTAWTPVRGPTSANQLWTFQEQSGFRGGPVVAADGTIYIAARRRNSML